MCYLFQIIIIFAEVDPLSSDGYYFHALSLAQFKRIDQAFEITRECTLRVTNCQDDVFRLSAGLAVQLYPPNFDSAIDAYGELLRRNKNDFDSVRLLPPVLSNFFNPF